MSETLSINNIRTDGGTQPRVNLYEETVSEYAEALQEGAEFPPIVVFHDGSGYWLADGFHRFHAHRKAGRDEISAEVRQGTRQDARDYANSGAPNGRHGLRESKADRWGRIENMLRDHPDWTLMQVGEHCEVSHMTVKRVRESIFNNVKDTGKRTVTRNGTTYTQDTSNIGTQKPDEPITEQEPTALDKEVETPEQPTEQRQPQSRGVGVRMAHEAIATLKRIPLNDGLRQDAFDMVQDWIETNRG